MRTESLARFLLGAGLVSTIASILIFLCGGSTGDDNVTQSFFQRAPPRLAHFGPPDNRSRPSDPASTNSKPPVTLIVGGTDGSGTRGVVNLLDKLGVPITADNAGTLDTNGIEMGGWPPTVRLVLDATRTADYQVSDLPKDVLENVLNRVHRYWSFWRSSPELLRMKKGQSKIAWAFKAPVSMILLPIFVEVARRKNYGKVKFLHVIRDGRDISYSGNQSPVKKFYNVSFPVKQDNSIYLKEDDKRTRAIRLWSTWNTQVLAWEQRTAGLSAEFDFLILHIEDLVSSDIETRRAAIASVARFVGSSIDNVGLCCLANEGKQDMGSHTRKDLARDSVESRYGKWKSLASPEMISKLNEVGMGGLEAFGYKPYKRPVEQTNSAAVGSCDFDPCSGWTAPQSLMTRLARQKRMHLRDKLEPRIRDRKQKRVPILGMQALSPQEALFQAQYQRPKDEDGAGAQEMLYRRRDIRARANQNRFRKHVGMVDADPL